MEISNLFRRSAIELKDADVYCDYTDVEARRSAIELKGYFYHCVAVLTLHLEDLL